MKRFFSLIFVFMLVWPMMGCGPKPPDATTIVKEYYAAMNAYQLDKVMSYLSDDVIAVDTAFKTLYKGKTKFKGMVQHSILMHIQYENKDYSEKNGEVRYSQIVSGDSGPIATFPDGLTVVKDGKIIYDGLESDRPK